MKQLYSEQRQFVHRNIFENLAQHIIWDTKLTQKFALSISHYVGRCLAAEYLFTHFNHLLTIWQSGW